MSVSATLKKSFVGLGDKIVQAVLHSLVTEEKGSEYFHGILSPRIRDTARSLVHAEAGRILEIGCGDGRFVIPVAIETGRPDVGLDLFPSPFCAAVERRSEEGVDNLALLRGSGMELPFRNDSFESVVCVNTLNSMPTKEAAKSIMSEMARVCRPGGCLVLDYRNERNPVMHYRFKWRRIKYPNSSLNQITFKDLDLVQAFHEYGCSVDRRVPIFFPSAAMAPAVVVRATKGG